MNKEEALEILKKEKEYEDDLVEHLNTNIIASLHEMQGLSEEEEEKVLTGLMIILQESMSHSATFAGLIKRVENGEGEF